MSEEKTEIMEKIENFDLKPLRYKGKHVNLDRRKLSNSLPNHVYIHRLVLFFTLVKEVPYPISFISSLRISYIVFWSYLSLLSTPSRSIPTFQSNQLCPIFVFKPFNMCCSYTPRCVALTGWWPTHQGLYSKESWLLFSQKLPIARS